MKFYGRETETKALQEIEKRSSTMAQLTIVSGRPRVGKTTLVQHAIGAIDALHFVVGAKSEALLCSELGLLAKRTLGEDLGMTTSLPQMVGSLMEIAEGRNFTLVMDDFHTLPLKTQNEIVGMWAEHKQTSHINMIVVESLHDETIRPCESHATTRIRLEPFGVDKIKEIVREHNPQHTPDDLLTFCMLTGGVARYVEELANRNAFTRDAMLDVAICHHSIFVSDGLDLLTAEFGKDCNTYISILAAIAEGYTKRGEITAFLNAECGGFLDKLEKTYGLIRRHRPFLQPEGGRNVTYGLRDNYLTFWLRYIYKYNSLVAVGDFASLREIIAADHSDFSTHILERYFRQKYRETGLYDIVSNYWEKGGANAIPVIAANDAEKKMLVAGCGDSLHALKAKAQGLMEKRPDWQYEFVSLTPNDM